MIFFLAALAGGIGACAVLVIFTSEWKKPEKKTRLANFFFKNWFAIILITTFSLTIPFIPYIFEKNQYFNFGKDLKLENVKTIDVKAKKVEKNVYEKSNETLNTGVVGDTFGGLTAPFIGIFVAILTFLAFYVQFKANEQQKKDLRVERFENKFYKMLELHKANVNEMAIGKIVGRKCFIPMFSELRDIYNCLKSVTLPKHILGDEDTTMSLAYSIFFYGIGENSEKNYVFNLSDLDKQRFQEFKNKCNTIRSNSHNEQTDSSLPLYRIKKLEGHANILGHYYRHLVHTVKFIHEQPFDMDIKYSYMKTVRAQLSNYEQLLLYYNAISWFDKLWKPYFVDYRFIKNIPLQLADFHSKPEDKFAKDIARLAKNGIKMFENQSTPIKK